MDLIPNGISVVIPTYNRAHLIKESLQSVLDQTLQPLEIIVVDDFSTDNTEEVVKSLNSPLIKFIKNQRKKGANGARNTGILMAKGEYIAFHDSDDIWLNHKLEEQNEIFMIHPDIDICFCSFQQDSSKKMIMPPSKIDRRDINKKLLKGNFISTQTIVLRKNKLGGHLFDENIKRFQDWDFMLSLDSLNIFHLDKILVIQKVQNNSISKNINDLEAFSKIFEKYPGISSESIKFKMINNMIKLEKSDDVFAKIILFFVTIIFNFLVMINNFKKTVFH